MNRLLRQSSSSGPHLDWSVKKVSKFFQKFFFIFFNNHFLLLILASVDANHKISTESDVLNKIVGVLKYAPDKIGGGAWKDDNDE